MNWIKTKDGYVRTSAVIDVHKAYWGGWKIMFVLTNGNPATYKYYGAEEKTEEEIDKEIADIILDIQYSEE